MNLLTPVRHASRAQFTATSRTRSLYTWRATGVRGQCEKNRARHCALTSGDWPYLVSAARLNTKSNGPPSSENARSALVGTARLACLNSTCWKMACKGRRGGGGGVGRRGGGERWEGKWEGEMERGGGEMGWEVIMRIDGQEICMEVSCREQWSPRQPVE